MTRREPPTRRVSVVAAIGLVVVVCGAIYWPWLGYAGLSSTEGHRVIPGWTMLETGEWLEVRLFERPYLRKPPGMPWAVAVSGALFGPGEWSARAVSALAATLASVVVFLYGRRWLGSPWGLVAGLAHALTPWFWGAGRSAEIESLHQLGVVVTGLALTDLLVERREFLDRRSIEGTFVLAAGLMVMVGSKGPAAAPVVIGVAGAAWLVLRSFRRLVGPGVLVGSGLAAVVIARLGWATVEATGDGERAPVTQGLWEFLWFGKDGASVERVVQIVVLAPGSLLAALPISIGIPLVLWRGPLEAHGGEPGARAMRVLALGSLLALGIYTVIGISNTRYAMPAAALLGPVFAGGLRRLWTWEPGAEVLSWVRRAGVGVGVALLAVGIAFAWFTSRNRERKSGRDAGIALAEAIGTDAELWADHLVEARPEVLWYARERGREAGWEIRPRWVAHERAAAEAPPGVLLVLRTDEKSPELESFDLSDLEGLATGSVHEYTFGVFRARGGR